jgi:hypothetical protein
MKYKIRQRSTHMVTDATAYHTIDSKEFIDCTPKYEGASQREFISYLDTNFRDEKTILDNEDVLSKYTVDTLYSLFIMPELKPLNSTKNIDEHAVLEIVEVPEGYNRVPKPKTAKIFIM